MLPIQTNKTTARIFPAVLDVENPEFQRRLDNLVVLSDKMKEISESAAPEALKKIQNFPVLLSFLGEMIALYFMPVDAGSVDFEAQLESELVY